MKYFIFLFHFFIAASLWGVTDPSSSKTVVKGIILLGENAKLTDSQLLKVVGVQSLGVRLPGSAQVFKDELGSRFIGKELNPALFMHLRSQIARLYQNLKLKQPRIIVPMQDFREGVIQVYLIPDEDSDAIDGQQPYFAPPDTLKPPPPPRAPVYLSKKPQMPRIKHLVLVSSSADVGKQDVCQNPLEIYDVDVPGKIADLECDLIPLFLNQSTTKEVVTKLKRAIINYYRTHDRPVVAVLVPEQDVTDGFLYLVVIEGCLGEVCVKGNHWFSKRRYEDSIRLKPGKPIRSNRLLTDLAWLNRNPFRRVDAYFTPGQKEGTTNIELAAKDRFPIQVYLGGDNTGTESTGETRYFAGATWGNAFWLDHLLTYQFTTSQDLRQFKAQTMHYTAPLPWRHLLIVYGGYAEVHPDMEGFSSEGHNFQSSLRYSMPFGKNYRGSLQELTLGFDFKNTDNNLLFVAEEQTALITKTVNLTQFMLGYVLGRENDWHKLSLNLNLFFSPAKFLAHQSDQDFSDLSPNAKSKYVYGRLTVGEIYYLPYRYSLSLQGRLQLASEVLLQSEQFGLGGYDTVRGYPERIVNADNALCLNAELRTRPVSILRFFNFRKVEDELYFLAFFDYGLGNVNDRSNTHPLVTGNRKLPEKQILMSFGPGMRYFINRHLSARVDWGVKLHKLKHIPNSGSSRSKFHVGLILSY